MSTDHLDLSANNATNQLYASSQESDGLQVDIYSVTDWDSVVLDTPLHEKKIKERIATSPNRIHHASDALRLAAIYKLGGMFGSRIFQAIFIYLHLSPKLMVHEK